MEQCSYESLHDGSRNLAEFLELTTRHDCEVAWIEDKIVPGHTISQKLVNAIQERFSLLSKAQRDAAIDLRTAGANGNEWRSWLEQHKEKYPTDALILYHVQDRFHGNKTLSISYALASESNFQPIWRYSRPWVMYHDWRD